MAKDKVSEMMADMEKHGRGTSSDGMMKKKMPMKKHKGHKAKKK